MTTDTTSTKLSPSARSAANRIDGNWQARRYYPRCQVALMFNCVTGDKMLVKEFAPGEFRVRSHSSGSLYVATLGCVVGCGCPDAQRRERTCKHHAACVAFRAHVAHKARPVMTAQEMAAFFGA